MSLIDCGCYERTKGAVHGAVGLLALVCATYNVAKWLRDRQPRHAVNGLVYTSLVGLELYQVNRHWGKR